MDPKERNQEVVDRILHEAMYRWYLVGSPAIELKERVELIEICGRQLLELRRRLGGESLRAFLNHLDRVEEDLVKLAEPDGPASPPPPAVDEALVLKLARGVDELELSVRAKNALKNAGISYVLEIVQKIEVDLLQTKARGRFLFGHKTVNEIKGVLEALGLSLDMMLDAATLAEVKAVLAVRKSIMK